MRKFLRRPNSFVLTEPHRSWIEQRGGLVAIRGYLLQVSLPKDERNLLDRLMQNPEESRDIAASELGVGRTRYFGILNSLVGMLAYHLNEWGAERTPRQPDLPAARCRQLWGRADLIDEVIEKLKDPAAPRIVLLTAYGGYGKTELARHIAAQLVAAGTFGDVTWLSLKQEEFQYTLGQATPVLLALEPSRSTVLRTIMHRLACQSEHELRSRLRNEAVLLVVDNLESLPLAEREAMVSDIHQVIGTGPSRALFTSRFDIVAPYVYKPAIAGLGLAESIELLRHEAEAFPRAAELRGASPDVFRRIWELTEGAPLALHLVVGQCQYYELRQVIANLGRARSQVAGEGFYQFLHEQAWQELSDPARVLLVFLGMVAQAPQTSVQLLGISVAAAVTFDEQTLHEAVGELAQWFLVERAELDGTSRDIAYSLHSLTRAFVLQEEMRERWEKELKLAEADFREAALRKHQESVHGLGEDKAAAQVYAEILSRAIPDFLHAMHYYLAHEQPEEVLWYWQSISEYLWLHGRYLEYQECDQYALAAAEQLALRRPTESRRTKAIISAELAFCHMELGDGERAEQYAQDAEDLFRASGDLPEVARALRYRAAIRARAGDFDTAEALCHKAFLTLDEADWQGKDAQQQRLTHPRADHVTRPLARRGPIHNLLGAMYLDQGNYAAARRELITALRAARNGPLSRVYWSLAPMFNLGRVHEQCSNVTRAKWYYRQCIDLTEDGTRPNIRAAALLCMARLAADEGERERASHLAHEAARLYEVLGTYGDKMKALAFLETLDRDS